MVSLLIGLIACWEIVDAGAPATAPLPVLPASAPSDHISLSLYVTRTIWNEALEPTFPIVVESNAESHSRYVGLGVAVTEFRDFDKGSLTDPARSGKLPPDFNRLYITYDLLDQWGAPLPILPNRAVPSRSFTIESGSTFEKFIATTFNVGQPDQMTLRAYLFIGGELVASSDPLKISITGQDRGKQHRINEMIRRGVG
jgi:hypothetical protein